MYHILLYACKLYIKIYGEYYLKYLYTELHKENEENIDMSF